MNYRVSQKDFARLVGVSPPAVSKWIRQGKLTLGTDGLLDPREAARQLAANTDPSKLRARLERVAAAGAPADAGEGEAADRANFLNARARREQFAARAAEIDLAIKEGSVVARVDVDRQSFELARQAQQQLLAIPDRMAPVLAAESDQHRIHTLLTTEIHRAMNDIIKAAQTYQSTEEKS